jgi:hypothetical protein
LNHRLKRVGKSVFMGLTWCSSAADATIRIPPRTDEVVRDGAEIHNYYADEVLKDAGQK